VLGERCAALVVWGCCVCCVGVMHVLCVCVCVCVCVLCRW